MKKSHKALNVRDGKPFLLVVVLLQAVRGEVKGWGKQLLIKYLNGYGTSYWSLKILLYIFVYRKLFLKSINGEIVPDRQTV